MGICENRYTIVKISTVDYSANHYKEDESDVFFIPNKYVSHITGDLLNFIEPFPGSVCVRLRVPEKFSYTIRVNATSYLIIDHWDMRVFDSDNTVCWAANNLKEDEISNLIETIQAINLGLIDDIDVLYNMLKKPTHNWIKNYYNKALDLI